MKYIYPCALVLCLALIAAGQDYELSVTTIQVWVKAVDRDGKPATGLTAGDFEVLEDGKNVDFSCFEEINDRTLTAANPAVRQAEQSRAHAQPAPESKPDGDRKLVLFIDLLNTSQPEFLLVRKKAEQFLSNVERRGMQVMLVVLLPDSRMGIFEKFTYDINRVRARLATLRGNSQRDQRVANARRELSRIMQLYDGSPSVKMAENQARTYQRQEERETQLLLKALEEFREYWTKQYSDHAVVLYISGGVNAEPGKQYFDMIRGYSPINAQRPEYLDIGADLRSDLKKTIARLNRNNLTFYTVNTRGASNVVDNITESNIRMTTMDSGYLKDYQEFQEVIANETGGLAFRNSLNFEDGLNTILTDITHYYLICYNPPAGSKQGKYRKIEVRAKKPGVRVRHRTGYQS